jgi:hypothetical protein
MTLHLAADSANPNNAKSVGSASEVGINKPPDRLIGTAHESLLLYEHHLVEL